MSMERGLETLHQALAVYLERELTAHHGNSWWNRGVQPSLHPGPDAQIAAGHIGRLSVEVLLRVFLNQWNIVFRSRLDRLARTYAHELRDIRNRWAHRSSQQPFTADDTARTLDTIGRFLEIVNISGSGDVASSVVEAAPDSQQFPDSVSRSTSTMEVSQRLRQWRELQTKIQGCRECLNRWHEEVVQPLRQREIPDPPGKIKILFVGVAPTAQTGRSHGTHFYSNEKDLLRRGLLKLLTERDSAWEDQSLRDGNRKFHDANYFFVHAAKVRPITKPAPPKEAIGFCALRHLKKEILLLKPTAICFLGKNNATPAAKALFGVTVGEKPQKVELEGWKGWAVVADQPRRGWEKQTTKVLKELKAQLETSRNE